MLKKISPALRLALLYLFFSGSWILLSDMIVENVIGNNPELMHRVQSAKGLSFVILCSILLYFVSKKYDRNIRYSLQQSKELLKRYQALSEATKEGVVDYDFVKGNAVINDRMKWIIREKSNIVESYLVNHHKRVHPEDVQRIVRNLEDTLSTRSQLWQADYRYYMFDGHYHDVIESGFIIRDKGGRPLRMISALQDVTELRNMKSVFYEQQFKHKRLLGQSIVQAQEEERNRWAQELHDNVCQLLTVVKLYLDQLISEQSSDSSLLAKAQHMTSKALNDIRQLSASIKPPEFSITTLAQSVEQLLLNFKRVNDFQYRIELAHLEENRLSDEQKLMVYRVVQEQLNNIMKYAAATQVDISISRVNKHMQVEIADNGKGFDTSKIGSGIGLRNIRSRLQAYAGNLSIESAPGEGCMLSASFSLE